MKIIKISLTSRIIILITIISIVSIIFLYIFKFSNKNYKIYNNDNIEQLNLYDEIVEKRIELYDNKSIDDFIKNNPDKQFTIGSLTKTITSAGILLFSLDNTNEYLFQGKKLEITIGELLYNRQKYLKSLKNPTEIQKKKLDFINSLISFTDKRIMDTKVYKVLNHTSVFEDDFNDYLLYLIAQKFLSFFPKETQDKLMFFGIQTFSLYFGKNSVDDRQKYSNMGFMYIIGIMSLMTDKKDFYEEVENRIFKPLEVENKIMRGDTVQKEELKRLFPNSSYANVFDFKITKKIININVYDLNYTEMDTLNGGLITDLNSANTILTEIIKLFLGENNRLSNNKEIPNLFFKYKTIRESDNEYYSLGATIEFLEDSIKITTNGNAFGVLIYLKFIVPKKINQTIDKDLEHFKYSKDSFDLDDIKNEIYVNARNILLYNTFFNPFRRALLDKDFKKQYKEILLKSIFDLCGTDYNKIIYELNNNLNNLIKSLKKQTIKNIKYYYKKDKNGKKEALSFFKYYFDVSVSNIL